MERLFNDVVHMHPVTTRNPSFIAASMMQVCTLGHQTDRSTAVEYARAKAVV